MKITETKPDSALQKKKKEKKNSVRTNQSLNKELGQSFSSAGAQLTCGLFLSVSGL